MYAVPGSEPWSKPRKRPFQDWLQFTSVSECAAVLDAVVEAMQRRNYTEKEIFGVRLALEEALVNAAKHGNKHDPTKCVWASWHIGPRRVLLEIEDEGNGFNRRGNRVTMCRRRAGA